MEGRAWLGIVAFVLEGACSSNPARTAIAVPLEIPEPPPRVAMAPVPAAEPPAAAVPVTASRPTAEIPTECSASHCGCDPCSSAATGARDASDRAGTHTAIHSDLLAAGPPGRTPTATQVRDSLTRIKQKLNSNRSATA